MEEKLKKQMIVILAGLPLAGKTTIGNCLKDCLEVPFIDIDEVRYELFHHSQDKIDPYENLQMELSYKAMFIVADFLIQSNRSDSIIVAATFSRSFYHQLIFEIVRKNNIDKKVFLCQASDEIIKKRLRERKEKDLGLSNCRTFDHYLETKNRYITFPEKIVTIDTSKTLEENLKEIVHYLNL